MPLLHLQRNNVFATAKNRIHARDDGTDARAISATVVLAVSIVELRAVTGNADVLLLANDPHSE